MQQRVDFLRLAGFDDAQMAKAIIAHPQASLQLHLWAFTIWRCLRCCASLQTSSMLSKMSFECRRHMW